MGRGGQPWPRPLAVFAAARPLRGWDVLRAVGRGWRSLMKADEWKRRQCPSRKSEKWWPMWSFLWFACSLHYLNCKVYVIHSHHTDLYGIVSSISRVCDHNLYIFNLIFNIGKGEYSERKADLNSNVPMCSVEIRELSYKGSEARTH